jgi:uncharacterized membrane protein YccC
MPQSDARLGDFDDLLPDLGVADVLRQRPTGISSVRHAVRIAIAVTVAWVVADQVSQSTFALFAPITTLLVVQSSPWTTLGVSVQRILGTGIGVLLASVYVNLLGLSWWSFLFGVLAALLIARVLPWSLGGQLQIPVAVVFVLALGAGSLQQDLWRVLDVLIGGAIGLLAVFVFPQRPRPERFEAALREYRAAIVATVRAIGAECGTRAADLGPAAPHDFVQPSRRLRDRAQEAREALLRLAEASALNVRAGAVRDDLEDRALRLRRLSGIGVQVRGIVGAANRMYDRPGNVPGLPPALLGELLADLVQVMDAVLGTGQTPVGGTARGPGTPAEDLDAALAARLRLSADDLAQRHEQAWDVLASVSLLGRIDHVRQQLAEYPEWEA